MSLSTVSVSLVRRYGRKVTLTRPSTAETLAGVQVASRRATQDDLVGSAYQYNYLYTVPIAPLVGTVFETIQRGDRITEPDGSIRTVEHVHPTYVGEENVTRRCGVSG